MPTADHDDAHLILRLFELRREAKMREAREWFAGSFKVTTLEEVNKLCPPGSETNAYMRMVVSYWEMAASFITSGVMNQELFFQSAGELLFCWARISPVIAEIREAFSSPAFAKNLEQVATAYIGWMEENSPGAYEAFKKRVSA